MTSTRLHFVQFILQRNTILKCCVYTAFTTLFCFGLFLQCNNSIASQEHQISALKVEEIAPGIFVAVGEIQLMNPENRGHIANLSFVVGSKHVAVIDTGGSFYVGQRLRAAIRLVTDLPISYVINTHSHPDHMLGNAAFLKENAEFIAHKHFNTALAQRGEHYMAANLERVGKSGFSGTGLIPSTRSVSDEMSLDLGGRMLHLIAKPTAHTDNDLIIIDKQTNTAFLGDLLFVDHIPALDGSLRGWQSVMDDLSNQKFKRAVPGHGPASVSWPAGLASQNKYLTTLISDLKKDIEAGTPINEASQKAATSERDAWELFDEFNTRNATAGYAELEWE